jgi:hypothetical protein
MTTQKPIPTMQEVAQGFAAEFTADMETRIAAMVDDHMPADVRDSGTLAMRDHVRGTKAAIRNAVFRQIIARAYPEAAPILEAIDAYDRALSSPIWPGDYSHAEEAANIMHDAASDLFADMVRKLPEGV